MDKKEITYADALNEIKVLVEFVNEKGMKMTFEEFNNIIESVESINLYVQDSEVIDEYTKENFNGIVYNFRLYMGKLSGTQSLLLGLEEGLRCLVK